MQYAVDPPIAVTGGITAYLPPVLPRYYHLFTAGITACCGNRRYCRLFTGFTAYLPPVLPPIVENQVK